MAAPVWVLSVDLQTKTATFQSGMADAAKSARTAFTDIKSGAGTMGAEVGTSTGSARQGVMLLGDEFGIHLPRGLTMFISSLGPVGPAMEAAFPFIAIALGATLLLERLVKLKEAGIQLTEDQVKFGTAVQNAYNSLDEKMLQAEKRTDELRGDHLGALSKELQLIDHQSMAELVHSFETVAKAADVVMKDLAGHWYSFGNDSAGAKHALEDFQAKYDSLLAQGKSGEATDLLKGTRESALTVLDTLQRAVDAGVGNTKDKLAAQQALVGALDAQLHIEKQVADLSKIDKGNATLSTDKTMSGEAAKKAREAAEAEKRASEEAKRFYEEAYRSYAETIADGERKIIAATERGSDERLAAIDSAIKEEEHEQLKGTNFYRELVTQRLELITHLAEEEKKLRDAAAKESTEQEMKMGQLSLAAKKEQMALADSGRRVNAAQRIAEETQIADQEYAIKLMALQREIAALDEASKEYDNKLQAILNKEAQLIKQHENEVTAIKDKAEMERNAKILSAEQHFNDTVAAGMTQVLMGHKSFASQMNSIGNQVVTGMMENALKSVLANDFTKESDAAAAARKMYLLGTQFPWPVGAVMGPVLGAMAFASVMAFEGGTDAVPGIGRGDTVPAMLTPGEGVVPGGVMDNLRSMARSGNMGGGTNYHVHHSPTYHVNTIDGDGIRDVLQKHSGEFTKHVNDQLRKMNR